MENKTGLRKGSVELLLRKDECDPIHMCDLHSELHMDQYIPAFANPVPIHEIDSPYDLYGMYSKGPLLIGSESLGNEDDCEPLYENASFKIKHGDAVAVHMYDVKKTVLFLFADPSLMKKDQLRLWKAVRNKEDPFSFLNLKVHENFQQKWLI